MDGPAPVVAHRIDHIERRLREEGLSKQFHPTYTRMVPAHYITEIALVGCPDPNPKYVRYFAPRRETLPPDPTQIGAKYVGAVADADPPRRGRPGETLRANAAVRVIEPNEFAKLLKATADPVFRVLLITGYYQGMRRTELANLRWSAVDLDKGAIHVLNVPETGEFTKSRKNWTIPTHPVARREMTAMRADAPTMVVDGPALPKHPHVFAWPDGLPYKPDWITHRFAALANAAGLSASIHDLRRSFSTLAQRPGVDRMTGKDLGRWSDVAIVEKRYTGETKPMLERAMDQIARAHGVA